MSRRLAALACGIVTLPALLSPTVVAAATPHPAQSAVTAKTPATPSATTASTGAGARKTAPKTVFTSRVSASPQPLRDRAGRTWQPRSTGFGSWNRLPLPTRADIARTDDDVLYRSVATDVRWYRLDVPEKATYRVRLMFADHAATRAGQRVFDVRAEGRVVARDVDVVRRVGAGAAHDITVNVPVSDGRLDLEFVAKKGAPILAGVEVTSTAPVAPLPEVSPKVALSADTFFRADVSKAPLAANSARASAHLAKQVDQHWGGVAAFNARRFNNSFYEVGPNQPKVRVKFHDCQKKGYTPAGLYDGAKHFVDVPIPANAVPATGTDKQLTVYDRSADKLWDFWVTSKDSSGAWQACWGGRIDSVSENQGIFTAPYGATASGLAMTPGVITLDEFRRGRIDHAMYLAIIEPAAWNKVSWPANRSDGWSSNPDALMEGQRVRLDPELDLSTVPLTPVGRMVAEAAQKYGFVIADKAGAVAVVTESGNAEKARTGVDPWDTLLPGPDYQALRNFPWEHIQVLPKDYGRPAAR